MKFYLAPMESVTGYIFRNIYKKYFNDIDRYITPFIKGKKLSSREKNDVIPEHNQEIDVVPQMLTNSTEDFLSVVDIMKNKYGYKSINLNLGCPSGTVVNKKRGAGFLSDLSMLEKFLDEIFKESEICISIKTRIGVENIDEWEEIIELYNKYPLEELIVHPRLRQEFYSGKPHLEIYEKIVKKSKHSLCYNGDINTVEDYKVIAENFPSTNKIMLGRGLLANPGLIGEINGKKPLKKDKFRNFHDEIYFGYKEVMSGDTNTLFKMKELWTYFSRSFEGSEKHLKKIRKSQKCSDYDVIVNSIFNDLEYKNF